MTSVLPTFSQPAMFVLLPCDVRYISDQPFNALGKKYCEALRIGANVLPIALPVGTLHDFDAYLSIACGVMFPGSVANVHPSHYGQAVHDISLPLDRDRDDITLPLMREVIRRGMPLLAICRGHQELNVALGGSLHQAVEELPNHLDHRARTELSLEQMYAPMHHIDLVEGGVLEALFKTQTMPINSLHGQAIDRLADGLIVDARCTEDGTVEAVRIKDYPTFALGCQFHPEWDIQNNRTGQVIFKAFGEACNAYAAQQNAIRKTVPTG